MYIELDFDEVGFEDEVREMLSNISITQGKLVELGGILVDDIKEGIDKGQDLNSFPFVSNTQAWIKRKGNTTPYIGKTHRLYDSIKISRVDDNSVEVSVTSPGINWQTNPKNPFYKRNFFGFSQRILDKIKKWLT